MSTAALYNAEPTIWANYREHLADMPCGGSTIRVTDDGSINNGFAIIARTKSKRAAIKLLMGAGFKKTQDGFRSR